MFYFIVQTLLLALFVFVVGLFIGIFLKNMLCKRHLQTQLSHHELKRKGRGHRSGNSRQYNSVNTNTTTTANYHYNVNRSESAALAKKRTLALIGEQDTTQSVRSL